MTPYWTSSDGRLVIYHGDCRDVLPTLERHSVDLLLTDPPYGVKWQSGHRADRFDVIVGDESEDAALQGIAAALPTLRNHRHAYIFGRFVLKGLPLTESVELVWDKVNGNGGNLAVPWAPQHEYIQFTTYSWSAANRAAGDGRLAARLRRGSVLRYPRLNSRGVTAHPTEKPVDLLRELIESSSRIGETVLDPFMGSGSTGEAAKREDRRFIGIEIEERYCEIAAKRLEDPPLLAAMNRPGQGALFAARAGEGVAG